MDPGLRTGRREAVRARQADLLAVGLEPAGPGAQLPTVRRVSVALVVRRLLLGLRMQRTRVVDLAGLALVARVLVVRVVLGVRRLPPRSGIRRTRVDWAGLVPVGWVALVRVGRVAPVRVDLVVLGVR